MCQEKQVPSLDGQVAFARHTYNQLDFAHKQIRILSANLVLVIFNVVIHLHACVGQMDFELQFLKNKNRYVDIIFLLNILLNFILDQSKKGPKVIES